VDLGGVLRFDHAMGMREVGVILPRCYFAAGSWNGGGRATIRGWGSSYQGEVTYGTGTGFEQDGVAAFA